MQIPQLPWHYQQGFAWLARKLCQPIHYNFLSNTVKSYPLHFSFARAEGLEPSTYGFGDRRSAS